jgi:hypothetical protein
MVLLQKSTSHNGASLFYESEEGSVEEIEEKKAKRNNQVH